MMDDVVVGAHLLEAREAIAVARMPHGKREGIVRQHRFDAVWEGGGDFFEKARGRETRRVRPNRDHGFAAEIVDSRELEVVPRVTERRQVLQIDVHQLAGARQEALDRGQRLSARIERTKKRIADAAVNLSR